MAKNVTFLKRLSPSSFVLFLLGVFFLFTAIGFVSDASDLGRTPPLRFALSVLISGIFPVVYALGGFALRKQFWKAFIPTFALHLLVINLLARSIPSLPMPSQMNAADMAKLESRLSFDGYAVIAVIALGYACFVFVTITEGRRYFRVRAEIDLATEIHRVLVPPIATKIGAYEFYGQSLPSGDVGGDLVDLAGSEGHWVAYIADVSGHGVAPGVVMGMAKSAARMLLSSGNDTAYLLARLNEVLYPLKKPDMFVTFCFVAQNEQGLRIGLAGHPPILHFSAETQEVTPLECPNMPLGILPSGDFESSVFSAKSGDLFALYTDGFLEPANSKGEEYGAERLQAELQKHGTEPLESICRSLQESVNRHGAQFDDQSIILIRKL